VNNMIKFAYYLEEMQKYAILRIKSYKSWGVR